MLQRVWNVTDWPGKNLGPRNLMYLGKVVPPGRAVQVDSERLKKAHKVKKLIDKGFLYVGPKLPPEYVRAKKPLKAERDARLVESDGTQVGNKVKVPANHMPPGPPVKSEEPEPVVVADEEPPIDDRNVTEGSW